ncbi:hypothetical protein [Hahella sp. NBU794]|uniref:hypothetical protein n=1 Tax=Hahella sp. NBU794 TaxID=3422590 RepID=UPI003D6E1052
MIKHFSEQSGHKLSQPMQGSFVDNLLLSSWQCDYLRSWIAINSKPKGKASP